MNKNNESNLLDSFMDEGEGAPELSENGGSSVGPNFRLQDLQSDTPMMGVVSLERVVAPYANQVMTPTHLKPGTGQIRTSLSVNSAVINTPTNISVSSVSAVHTSGNVNSVSGGMVSPVSSGMNSSVTSPTTPARKRLKMVDNEKVTHSDDILSLKKRILEHKLLRLKSIRERYAEHTAEMFYLQAGGNMMDYQAWRKRPPTPQLLSFFRTHCLEPGDEGEELSRALGHAPLLPSTPQGAVVPHSASVSQTTSVPQGAEIKIPGVGATPVAVSTTLPAAVAQLTQIGGTPLMVEGSSSSPAPKACPPASAPSTPTAQEHMVEKAKQEAYVMQRISDLQKEGLWSEKRLPKVMEPARPKAHWDYLLEEMVWLAADFAQERKWKKAAAKKCARMVQKHFHEKAMMAQKAEKAHELQLRRIAAFVAKEIKTFWSNVEKLVEFKQQTRLEEQRKQALDQQLSFIVDQTEKYSQQLAQGMRQHTAPTSTNTSACPSDDEFHPSNALSSDDEETIAAAEKLDVKDGQRQAEVEALQRESQMDLDQFLDELPQDYLQNRDKIQLSEADEAAEDSEFQAEEDSTDDEDTIMEQEKQEGQHDHAQEIDTLKAEGEMSIDELMKKYSGAPTTDMSPPPTDDEESDNDSTDNEDIAETTEESETEVEGLDELVKEGESKEGDEDHRMEDAAAIAESIQPKGNTLSSTQVVTKVPFLLKHSLREYQHIGLDWLVTMEQRRLNGILADEMGLGKTIQTIALIAHLACEKEDWGPHLIVVPTSVMLNWEMEFKKWCPAFKILTYYGTIKERKLKRIGWTKPNAFHICITSYKLVIQDHQSFRRKKWKYLILDEAQNIKNFKSQRWQLLLNFQTQQRLLLTGTPLQNNLMELWSLMHFLMPDVFASHREFKEWFSNPVTGMIEGNSEYNETIIKRLHKVLRPFLLRRLKCEVEKQMPKKYEHVVMCRLSKRQRFLYEDFMSRAKTKETLAAGNLLSVINVLMQLRKVCNHPNLFEVRPIISPFQMTPIQYDIPSLVYNATNYDPFTQIDFAQLNLNLLLMERTTTAFASHRVHHLSTPRKLIEEIDTAPPSPPPCPSAEFRMHISIRPAAISAVDSGLQTKTSVLPGTSPRMYTKNDPKKTILTPVNTTPASNKISRARPVMRVPPLQSGDSPKISVSTSSVLGSVGVGGVAGGLKVALVQPLTPRVIRQLSAARTAQVSPIIREKTPDTEHSEFKQASLEEVLKMQRKCKLSSLARINDRRCSGFPLYGRDLRDQVTVCPRQFCQALEQDIKTVEQYAQDMHHIFERFVVHIPAACSRGVVPRVSHGAVWRVAAEQRTQDTVCELLNPLTRLLHPISSRMSTHFPDPRLIQYDCGKLQTLDVLLRKLKNGQHRVLIFTQMTKMLDVLEAFLNCHGHIYLRLDGTTRVEQRQVLMERFNADPRIFVFILSTRSGGVGVNLTGADTVIFYDSDWNPTMDAQAQDRCHRIGQTRDVHIYRLISEMTVEENILKKANQKRMLGDVAIEGGNFTTAYFKSSTIQDLFNVGNREESAAVVSEVQVAGAGVSEGPASALALESALAQCEDEADVAAARGARAEAQADLAEFDENIPIEHTDAPPAPEMTKAEAELQNLMQQLSPVERYAMRLVEASDAATTAERQAAAEMDKQLRDWEAARRALQREPEPEQTDNLPTDDDDDDITFSREDATNQIWISDNTEEQMPMWCPPTPPQGDEDMYIDASMSYLYDCNVMTEMQLPPVYVKRDLKRSRADMGHSPDGRRPLKMHRKEESVYAPRSLFERPSPATAKLRRDLKLQKYRGIVRTQAPAPGPKSTTRPYSEPENVPEWSVSEEMALLQAIKLQGLPLNLVILSPAHTPNWDLAADMVNTVSRIYQSPRQCRNRYESVLLPREEGKASVDNSQKKQKKTKSICKTPTQQKSNRPMRTAQLYELDNNVSYTQAILSKYESMKFILNKKASTPKRRYDDLTMKNPKHAVVLAENGINYDNAPSPMEVATRRADRIAREKQKVAPSTSVTSSAVEAAPVARLASKPAATSTPPPAAAPAPVPLTPAPAPTAPRASVQRTVQTQAQEQMVRAPQRIVVAAQQVPNVVAKGITAAGTITSGGKPLNQAQYQLYKQQALAKQQQMKLLQQQQQAGVAGHTSAASATLQQRAQVTQVGQSSAMGKATVARTVTEGEISALLKRQQALGQQKGQQQLAQMFTTAVSQQGQPIQVATVSIAGGVAKSVSGVAGMAGATGKAPMKMATPQQLRQLQLQQQLALVQRKSQKVTQLTQVSGGVGAGAGVGVVTSSGVAKSLPAGVTVQQLQQVMRQMPSARVVPRPTIQVVGGARSSTAVGSVNHQVILSAALQARAHTHTPDTTLTSTPPSQPQPPDT